MVLLSLFLSVRSCGLLVPWRLFFLAEDVSTKGRYWTCAFFGGLRLLLFILLLFSIGHVISTEPTNPVLLSTRSALIIRGKSPHNLKRLDKYRSFVWEKFFPLSASLLRKGYSGLLPPSKENRNDTCVDRKAMPGLPFLLVVSEEEPVYPARHRHARFVRLKHRRTAEKRRER